MKPLLFICILCLLLPGLAQADAVPDIIINEVAWMGTASSANDEWIELFNQADAERNIDGWLLKTADGSPGINLTGTIPAKGFWLLERTDDHTLTETSADQIYTGALNNNGENLELYDNTGKLIDVATGANAWPAGDNITKQTMERKDFGSWQTSQNAGGTPKAKNSAPTEKIITAPAPSSSPAEQPKITDDQKKPEEDNSFKNLAAAGEQISPKKDVAAITLLIALTLAIFSGAIILILKKGLK